MTTQTEAERLADALERQFPTGTAQSHLDGEAAAELRRLVSFNQQLMDEVARLQKAVADEREAIMDEWWMCVQSDLENGVKSLNERAAEKWKKEYPAIAGFAATIEARGNT